MDVTEDSHFYRPQDGHGLPHDPFKAIVAPRLIGWISSVSKEGKPNLAPYSFFGAMSSSPPTIAFSSEGYKDSVRNIEETGEFTWNFVSRTLAEQMNATSATVARGVDEFELAGLRAAPGREVSVPYVADAPAVLECKALDIVRLKNLEGSVTDRWVMFGEVVGVHIRKEYLKDGIFDTFLADPVMRAGYRWDYAGTGDKFEMRRPK
jgi:flavin reductase (DIM6/NTAB) family NADH-FMN oxidoreductase RutF